MADKITAALYLRSATDNEDAIEHQRRLCTKHAAEEGLRIAATFVDKAVSGVKVDRPGLNVLRQFVREGRANLVLVASPDRIARDFRLLKDIVSFCDDHGARIASAAGKEGMRP